MIRLFKRKENMNQSSGYNYDPHALIELRDYSGEIPTFTTFKATDLEGMRERIKDLEDIQNTMQKEYDDLAVSNRYWIGKAEEFLNTTREWLLDTVANEEIEFNTAEVLAEKLGIELNREYEVTIQVEYNFTLKAKNDEQVEDILDELDIPSISHDAIDAWDVNGDIVSREYQEN